MSRINTNVQSMLAQRVLGQQNKSLNNSLERLSTGLQINRGRDNPAGLIASENLRSEKASIAAAIGNAERADQVINIAEGGLQEINTLLIEVQGLVTQSANDAGLSDEEKRANQLQIDSILQTIDRISDSTSFQGTKLLNGTFDFTVSGQDSAVTDFQINAAKLGHNEHRDVQVLVTGSAQQAALFLSVGDTDFDLAGPNSKFTIEIAGALGSREFSFASGTQVSSAAKTINTFKTVTGVSAVASTTGLQLFSTDYGSNQFVSVDVIDHGGLGTSAVRQYNATDLSVADGAATTLATIQAQNAVRDSGQDVQAIINGIAATADGLNARIVTDFLDLEISLGEADAKQRQQFKGFTITGGGAQFNLGPTVDINSQGSVGIQNTAARRLGSLAVGYLDELGSNQAANLKDGDLQKAQKIVDAAISQISTLRGRLGAFQKNVLSSTINNLGVTLENTSAAESAIRDTDFASETASLTRSQILVNAATNTLSLANSNPQSVLQLLG